MFLSLIDYKTQMEDRKEDAYFTNVTHPIR
jgi:hypothetical protein